MNDAGYISRHIDDVLDALLAELPAVMLNGPRGCGKTTTAARRSRSVLRLDRPDESEAFRAAPDEILAVQRLPVLIDEWQRVPDSLGAVKRAVDTGRGSGRYLVTGSVRARLSGAGWPATGRIVPLTMYGLTVAELESVTGPGFVNRVFDPNGPETGRLTGAPSVTDYMKHIVIGGFPDAINLGDQARAAWYGGYVEQLVRHDTGELDEVRLPGAMTDLLQAVALNTAGMPALASLAEATGLDQRTVKAFLDLLEDLCVVERLPAWGINRFKRMTKRPKYHVVDTGMAAYLAGDNHLGLLRSADRMGRLLDTFVMAQLRPLLRLATPSVSAFHLRDQNGAREIDIVLESAAGQVVGIEVKAANAVTVRDARHLAWLRDQLGDTFIRGVVLHTGTMAYPLGERLWALPVASLWQG